MERRAAIGVVGGSGLYRFLDDVETVEVDTPYGAPSDRAHDLTTSASGHATSAADAAETTCRARSGSRRTAVASFPAHT